MKQAAKLYPLLKYGLFITITICVSSAFIFKKKESKPQPNILWITCEDMSYHLGSFGDKVAKTPNLDQLAKEGVKYNNVFSTAGVCRSVSSKERMTSPAENQRTPSWYPVPSRMPTGFSFTRSAHPTRPAKRASACSCPRSCGKRGAPLPRSRVLPEPDAALRHHRQLYAASPLHYAGRGGTGSRSSGCLRTDSRSTGNRSTGNPGQ